MTISGIVLSLFANGKAQARPPATARVDSEAAEMDLCADTDPPLALRVAASGRLELIGVHHRLSTPLSGQAAAETVPDDHHLAPRCLRAAAAEKLESLVEDACARFRYPRPALVVQC